MTNAKKTMYICIYAKAENKKMPTVTIELEMRLEEMIEYQVAGRKSGTSAAAAIMEDRRVDLAYKIRFLEFTQEHCAPRNVVG